MAFNHRQKGTFIVYNCCMLYAKPTIWESPILVLHFSRFPLNGFKPLQTALPSNPVPKCYATSSTVWVEDWIHLPNRQEVTGEKMRASNFSIPFLTEPTNPPNKLDKYTRIVYTIYNSVWDGRQSKASATSTKRFTSTESVSANRGAAARLLSKPPNASSQPKPNEKRSKPKDNPPTTATIKSTEV